MVRSIVAIFLSLQFVVAVVAQTATPSAQDPQRPAQKPAQQEPDDLDVVKITTNLVQVDAVITDGKGNIVPDLLADEVEIFEDGKRQEITNFSFIPLASPRTTPEVKEKQPVDKTLPPLPTRRLRPEDVKRTIALVVDDLSMSSESVYFARRALKKFVEEDLQPNDLVAIIRTAGGIGALQQFTSDKRQLMAAIAKVRWNPGARGGLGAFGPISTDPISQADNPDMFGTRSDVDRPKGPTIEDLREDVFAVGTLGAVNYIVKGLKELPGRKSVMLMSDGFRLFQFGDTAANLRTRIALDNLIDTANRASVVIYTMDTTGLQPLNFTAADSGGMRPEQMSAALSAMRAQSFDNQGSLKYLANATGGIFNRNTNDLLKGIRRAIDDQKGYYLIGYRPDDETFERIRGRKKFHHFSVKVKRTGKFNVRMRQGFFGVPDDESQPVAKTPETRMIEALASPFNSDGVEMRLTSLFLNDPKLGPVMQSLLYIKASDLTFTREADGWHSSVIDLVAMTFGDSGAPHDPMSHRHTLRLRGNAFQSALKNGVTYSINVPVKKPGGYQLRTVLRDTVSDRIGSASQYIEVPDIKKKRLLLSGIVLHGIERSKYLNRNTPEVQLDDGGEDPLAGAASRQFHHGLVMEYGLVAYNSQIDKTKGKPNLVMQLRLFRNGKLVFTGKETTPDAGAISDPRSVSLSGALQLGTEMEPGEYVLQVLVRDRLAKKESLAAQWIDFEVKN